MELSFKLLHLLGIKETLVFKVHRAPIKQAKIRGVFFFGVKLVFFISSVVTTHVFSFRDIIGLSIEV